LKRTGKKTVLVMLFVCTGVAFIWWWPFGNGRKHDNQDQVTAKVTLRNFTSTVLATGAVKPQVGAEVRVGARISGKVEHLYANIGDEVKERQIIAELEKKDLEATAAQRQAELQIAEANLSAVEMLRPKEIEKAEADVAQYQATLTLAEKELTRQDDLLKQDFTTQQARDRAQERLSVAEAQLVSARKGLELVKTRYTEDLKQARADVERAEATLVNAKVQRSYATIIAPIPGVIASVSTQAGETVAAGLNSPTFVTIIDLKRLQVDAYVDEVDIGNVRVGQKAIFAVDAFPAKEFEGKVVAIYPKAVIQENVVNYDVVIEITTPYDSLLRPEMTAGVTIFLEARTDVLSVPAKAVKRERGKNIVYVLANGRPEPQEIKVGWKDSQWIEVAQGLEEGQLVLLKAPDAKQRKP
jgi:multidrug efflux pump subunit AcrA (membrane-fusion protein)